MTKAIVFDASTLISFAMNGLLEEVKALKSVFKGNFIITNEVKYEVIDRPIKIKRFELEALKVKSLLDAKIIELPSSIGIKDAEISKRAKEILDIANKTFTGGGKGINLLHLGEASCLALSKILNEKKVENAFAVDERTARMLVEKPDNLKKLFEKKLHTRITSDPKNYKFFEGIRIIRSAELAYVAYKKGLVRLKDGIVLDALLYALKFKGCAISNEEISEIKKLG
ncbi:hypothetical protein ACFLZJ_01725 [Nanoarchaeota archaeon]